VGGGRISFEGRKGHLEKEGDKTHLLLLNLHLQLRQQPLLDITPPSDLLRLRRRSMRLEDIGGKDDLPRVSRDGPAVTLRDGFEEVLREFGEEVERLFVGEERRS
jgi:hypothetical protein